MHTSEKAKKEWEARNRKAKEDEKEILKGANKIEADRIKHGGTNYALYNLIVSTVSYKDCETALDSCRRTYEGVYVYLKRLTDDNKIMRRFLEGDEKYKENPTIKEILSRPGDYQEWAAETLSQVTKAARERAKTKKLGIVDPKKEIII